jgi:hypothetical protein
LEDLYPRADNKFWYLLPTTVEEHVSVGAAATILCGVTTGRYSMVAAGATVTHDVPPHALVLGQLAKITDYVDAQGTPLNHDITCPPRSEKLLILSKRVCNWFYPEDDQLRRGLVLERLNIF